MTYADFVQQLKAPPAEIRERVGRMNEQPTSRPCESCGEPSDGWPGSKGGELCQMCWERESSEAFWRAMTGENPWPWVESKRMTPEQVRKIAHEAAAAIIAERTRDLTVQEVAAELQVSHTQVMRYWAMWRAGDHRRGLKLYDAGKTKHWWRCRRADLDAFKERRAR